jgi:hypothetical protein
MYNNEGNLKRKRIGLLRAVVAWTRSACNTKPCLFVCPSEGVYCHEERTTSPSYSQRKGIKYTEIKKLMVKGGNV